nr:YfiM family protein [Sphingomonas sp. Y57]
MTDGLARQLIWAAAMTALAASTAPALAQDNDDDRLAIEFDLPGPSRHRLAIAPPAAAAEPGYGPPPPSLPAIEETSGHRLSFGKQIDSIKWELGAALVWVTATNTAKVGRDGGRRFHFQDEGWFGKDTINLGMDKLTHAWNTYWITDMIEARIRRKTGATNAGLTAASLSMGVMLYAELWDAHKKSSGFSFQDIAMNASGAGFSLLRNAVPGLDRKLDFRLLLIPNKDIYTPSGTRHYRQMRYLFALKLAGFEGLENSPLRFVELHAGYRATGFTAKEEARGDPRRRRPFIGIGLNLNQLFFPDRPSGWAGRAASEALQYVQVPYTAYHAD